MQARLCLYRRQADVFEKVASLLAPEGLFVIVTPMLEDVEEDKKGVAIDGGAIELLKSYFDVVALYKVEKMTYIVGRAK
jgi:hypothetical protein